MIVRECRRSRWCLGPRMRRSSRIPSSSPPLARKRWLPWRPPSSEARSPARSARRSRRSSASSPPTSAPARRRGELGLVGPPARRRGGRHRPGRRGARAARAPTSPPPAPFTTTGPWPCRSTPSRRRGTWTSISSRTLVSERTRAVLPVHLFGHPVDMDRAAGARAVDASSLVIEDCAESHGATVRGRMTGSFGAMSCFSFYANKIITTGEGGMVAHRRPRRSPSACAGLRNLCLRRAAVPPRGARLQPPHDRLSRPRMGLAQLAEDRSTSSRRSVASRTTYDRLLADVPGSATTRRAGLGAQRLLDVRRRRRG